MKNPYKIQASELSSFLCVCEIVAFSLWYLHSNMTYSEKNILKPHLHEKNRRGK
jgi:hypothetical protein